MNKGDNVEIRLKPWFSRNAAIGAVFTGTITAATDKAIQIDGHSFLRRPPEKDGAIPCRLCSRPLTEEMSRSIGYGPECAVHLGLTNKVIRDLTRALTRDEIQAAERQLKKKLWIPRSQILASRPVGSTTLEEAVEQKQASVATIRPDASQIALNMQHEEVSDEAFPLALPFDCEPRPYQWRAARFMLERCKAGFGAPLWDLPGTGKTISAITFMMLATQELAQRGADGPVVVTCPPVMSGTWKRELEKWWQGVRVQILKGLSAKIDPKADVYVMPWSILAAGREPLRNSAGEIMTTVVTGKDGLPRRKAITDPNKVQPSKTLLGVVDQNPSIIVGDEFHWCKNSRSQRAMAFQKLVITAHYFIPMTGTPVLNRTEELITQLEATDILDKEFGGRAKFENEFTNRQLTWTPMRGGGRRKTYQSKPLSGTKLVELHNRLVPYVMRRRTEHVIKDMPPITIARVSVELANRDEYDALEEEIALLDPMERLGKMAQLRQLCGIGKIDSAIEWIENFLECEEKLITFATHRAIQHSLVDKFTDRKPAELLGRSEGSTDKKRQESMDRFQNDPGCLLAICSSGAAREGITLTAAANILDIELEWTPSIQDQKWARAYRLGQRDPVTIWVLTASDSMDDTLLDKLADKRRLTGEIQDGREEILTEQLIQEAVVKDLVNRVARRKRRKVA